MNSSNSYLSRKRASPDRYEDRYSRRENGDNYRPRRRSRDYRDDGDRYSTKYHRNYSSEDRRDDRRRDEVTRSRHHHDHYERLRHQSRHGELEDSESSDDEEGGVDDKGKHMKKNYNFLICLPKNFFRFIEQGYDPLWREVSCDFNSR
jgi:hypothetical protein